MELFVNNKSRIANNLTSICRQRSVSIEEVLLVNRGRVSNYLKRYNEESKEYNKTHETKRKIYEDDSQFLEDHRLEKFPIGYEILLPNKRNTGGLDNESRKYLYSLKEEEYQIKSTEHPTFEDHLTYDRVGSVPGLHNIHTSHDWNAAVVVMTGNSVVAEAELPVIPQEFSDNNSVSYAAQNLMGRSVAYQIYEGSSRSVSFTLQLHGDLCSDIYSIVSLIESANYPEYGGGVVNPPEIVFVIGKQFAVRGILTGCSASWKAPIIDGKYINCDLSVSVTETAGPFSQSEINSSRGNRYFR